MADIERSLIDTAIETIFNLATMGVSQREIARRSGLGRGTVYGILKGQHKLSARRSTSVVSAQIANRWFTVRQADGTVIRGQATRSRDATRLSHYGTAIKSALRGDTAGLESSEFSHPVTLVDGNSRYNVQLITDPDYIAELDDQGIDVIDYSETNS